MKPENKTKLDRLILRERIRVFIPVFTLSIVLWAVYFLLFDQSVSSRITIPATVQSWSSISRDKSHNTYALWVKLQDGSNVWATAATKARIPSRGEVIQVERITSYIGRVSYLWIR